MDRLNAFPLFDSHFHIIDPNYPLVANQGYLPAPFTAQDYRERMSPYDLKGGAVVSGSFQAFDQEYLLNALEVLGPGFVGVTQLPASTSDEELLQLDKAGVRALRFNLKRGGSEQVEQLDRLARRVHELVGWHTELYVDARELPVLHATLAHLPKLSIDHLGLSKDGYFSLLKLVEAGAHVKATGFGRIDFNMTEAVRQISAINPQALVFGTDLPSTRAPIPYADDDFLRLIDALGEEQARRVLFDNPRSLYRP